MPELEDKSQKKAVSPVHGKKRQFICNPHLLPSGVFTLMDSSGRPRLKRDVTQLANERSLLVSAGVRSHLVLIVKRSPAKLANQSRRRTFENRVESV